MDNVEPKKAGEIMGQVNTSTKESLVQSMSQPALINTLSETPIAAIKEINIGLLFQSLPQVPASQLAIVDPPAVDPSLPAPTAVQVAPGLVIYQSQTGVLTWGTLVGSPAPIHKILGKFTKSLPDVKIAVEDVTFRPPTCLNCRTV